MNYQEFLAKVIDGGIVAARANYVGQPLRIEGAIAGFEACRGKTSSELLFVLAEADLKQREAFAQESPDFWKYRCAELEVDWVCNCVSAFEVLNGRLSLGAVWPTARAMRRTIEVMGNMPGGRRGWRGFLCDCGKTWKLPTRDHLSPSKETCPNCNTEVDPISCWSDLTLPCDDMGNLIGSYPPVDYVSDQARRR